MNRIKSEQVFPEALNPCNITSLYKQKGSRKDLDNYRGVFRTTVLRSILDRLIYNDCYQTIDENLTDHKVGARKNRNIRDNIFVLGAVVNSVVNGNEEPIQIQVGDIEKCFDKLWLQATTNALYESGLKNDNLNLLYLENKKARVAVKINNRITERIIVKDVELQGSVWGSLKCTSSMDILNQIILPQNHLIYRYKSDNNVRLGVLGMVDDTLAISRCGVPAIQKNSVINSFIEAQRLTLSKKKSVLLHISGRSKCQQVCPTLQVQNEDMRTVESVRYLGDIISASGSLRPCIEERRSKGWGKLSEITAILSELPDRRQLEIGLKLRDTKLHNGILFNCEAWSSTPDKDIKRLEQVDVGALKALVAGHSKCPTAFYFLEFGTLMIKHKVMIKRLMYHHHILSRDDNELIKKVYNKQKEHYTKGDWFQTVKSDFQFIDVIMNENVIQSTPKEQYKKFVDTKVREAAFKSYLTLPETSKSKMKDLVYKDFKIQPYMNTNTFSTHEINLLFSLRSKCYPAKMNFKKLHRGDLNCSLKCDVQETQFHIFQECEPIRSKLGLSTNPKLEDIYKSSSHQKNAVIVFTKIDLIRKQLIDNILPGGLVARALANS